MLDTQYVIDAIILLRKDMRKRQQQNSIVVRYYRYKIQQILVFFLYFEMHAEATIS